MTADLSGLQRVILAMGTGYARTGENYTEAAARAVADGVRHSKLTFPESLGIDPDTIFVEVTLACQEPDLVDPDAAISGLLSGQVTVNVVSGGLNVPGQTGKDDCVIVNAGIVVRVKKEALAAFMPGTVPGIS